MKYDKNKKKEYDAEYYKNNKAKKQKQSKDWIKKNPEKRAAMIRRHKYGTDGEELFALQKGLCGICETDLNMKSGHKRHLDHCHETGRVRGWLCPNCNIGLGRFPNLQLLLKAIEFIKA